MHRIVSAILLIVFCMWSLPVTLKINFYSPIARQKIFCKEKYKNFLSEGHMYIQSNLNQLGWPKNMVALFNVLSINT